jgi:hypothetical protein
MIVTIVFDHGREYMAAWHCHGKDCTDLPDTMDPHRRYLRIVPLK